MLDKIFSKSFEDFKNNILLVLKASIILLFIPIMIAALIIIFLIAATANFDVFSSVMDSSALKSPEVLLSPISNSGNFSLIISAMFIIALVISLFYYFHTLLILYISIYNEKGKLAFKQAFDESLDYFWRVIGLMIIITLVMLGIEMVVILLVVLASFVLSTLLAILFTNLIIGIAVIFFIYLSVKWSLSIFILVREDTGIIESLKRSSLIVKNKWWLTFGCLLLFYLIYSAVDIIFYFISIILGYIVVFGILFSLALGTAGFIIFGFIFSIIFTIVISAYIALSSMIIIILMKNLYLELRTKR